MKSQTIVRVVDSYYKTKRGVAYKRELNIIWRKSCGYNIVNEEPSIAGEEDFIQGIENFLDVDEGIYEVVYSDIHYDWGIGYPDDWGYKLIPFTT